MNIFLLRWDVVTLSLWWCSKRLVFLFYLDEVMRRGARLIPASAPSFHSPCCLGQVSRSRMARNDVLPTGRRALRFPQARTKTSRLEVVMPDFREVREFVLSSLLASALETVWLLRCSYFPSCHWSALVNMFAGVRLVDHKTPEISVVRFHQFSFRSNTEKN